MAGQLIECSGQNAYLVIPRVIQLHLIVSLVQLPGRLRQLPKRDRHAARNQEAERDKDQQNQHRGNQDNFDHPDPVGIDFGERRRHVKPHFVGEGTGGRQFLFSFVLIIHQRDSLGEGILYFLFMKGDGIASDLLPRVIDNLSVFIGEEGKTVLQHHHGPELGCKRLIVDVDPDNPDEFSLMINRYHIGDHPRFQVFVIIRRQPACLSQFLRDRIPADPGNIVRVIGLQIGQGFGLKALLFKFGIPEALLLS